MAFQNNFDDDELKQQGQAPTTPGGGQVLAGGNAASPAGAPATSGSGYTNLDKYLGANAGQGGGLADTVTGNAQGQIDGARREFKGYGDSARASADAQDNSGAAKGFVAGINSDPIKVDSGAFKAFTTAGYGAPKTAQAAQGYGGAATSFGKAIQTVGQVDNRDAQKNVLKTAFKTSTNPGQQYTSGMNNLDSFVLNGDTAAQGKVSAFKTANAGLQNEFTGGLGSLDNYLGAAQGKFAANQADAKGAAQGAYKSLNDYGVAGVNRRDNDAFLKQFGKSTMADVLTADERARMAALSSLTDNPNAAAAPATVLPNFLSGSLATFQPLDLSKGGSTYNGLDPYLFGTGGANTFSFSSKG